MTRQRASNRRAPRSRGLLPAALACCLLTPGACSDGGAAGAAPPAEFQIPVTVEPVVAGEVVETVELVGDVVSRRRAELAFERPGRIVATLADLGDVVQEGQVLARLDDAVLREELAVARAATAAAETEAEYARREADRARELGTDLVREQEQDRLASDAVAAAHRAEQRRAELRRLTELLARGELRAPFDAVVTERSVTDGTFAAVGQVAFVLVDLEQREVRLELPAPVAARLAVGAELTLMVDELPGFTLPARLDQLVPAADPLTRTFTGVVRLGAADAERRLLPGLFARARLVLHRARSDAVVPADALRDGPDGAYLVLAAPPAGAPAPRGDGPPAAGAIATPVAVRVLARGAGRAAVEPLAGGAGPLRGAWVVVTGVDNVFPGAALLPSPHRLPAPGAGGGAAEGLADAAADGAKGG